VVYSPAKKTYTEGMSMKRNGTMAGGSLKAMSRTAVYKRANHDKLRGFFKRPGIRGVFTPLGKGTKTLVVR
jgi:hypothetical protein